MSDDQGVVDHTARQGLGVAKHIQFRRLWLKTARASGQLDVREVHTYRNAADVLTKALADFSRCAQSVGKGRRSSHRGEGTQCNEPNSSIRAQDLSLVRMIAPKVEQESVLRVLVNCTSLSLSAQVLHTCTSCSHSCQCCHIGFGSSFAKGSATPHSRHTTIIVRLSPNGHTTPPSCCRRFFDHALSFFSRPVAHDRLFRARLFARKGFACLVSEDRSTLL